MSELSRRQLLGLGGALGLTAAAGLSTAAALSRHPSATGAELRSAVPLPPVYRTPLPLPPVLKPISTAGGVDRYAVTQREASLEILPGVRTPMWTYEGVFPGPTIEARRPARHSHPPQRTARADRRPSPRRAHHRRLRRLSNRPRPARRLARRDPSSA
ncbi:hypothetical protein GCM10029976_014270 [Kribbella albertanoniae]